MERRMATPPEPGLCDVDKFAAEHSAELAESIAAIEQALAQADRGEGLPLDEFDRQFRARHGLDPLEQ
jgi:hypothetical protein